MTAIAEQNQPTGSAENAAQGIKAIQANQSHGGAVEGLAPAGSRTTPSGLLSGVKPVTAAEALDGVDVRAIVHDLLKNGSRPVKLQTLMACWDRIFGKPKQEIGVSGGLLHAHTRDPLLASMPKEALEELARAYDDIMTKHAPPVLEVAQDAPQNQIESKPAIEAEVCRVGGLRGVVRQNSSPL